MSEPVLTKSRNGVWNAITNATDLRENGQSVFHRQLRFDDDTPMLSVDEVEEGLGLGDLPTLAIFSRNVQTQWNRNSDQEWSFTLHLVCWTHGHGQRLPERYAERLLMAVHETVKTGTLTWVKDATGHHPHGDATIEFTPAFVGDDGDTPAMRTTVSVRLRILQSINI